MEWLVKPPWLQTNITESSLVIYCKELGQKQLLFCSNCFVLKPENPELGEAKAWFMAKTFCLDVKVQSRDKFI